MNEWIDHKEAAQLMMRPAEYLRRKGPDGMYLYFPSIERWQPGGRRTRLYVRREHVEAWVKASQQPKQVKQEFTGIGYEGALPMLRRLGADRVIRSLGLK